VRLTAVALDSLADVCLAVPALCVENVFNAAKKYTWTDTAASSGFVIPVAEQSADFWGDMFDYGAMLAAKTVDVNAKPWPGAWAPPAVEAGWKGTNLASYETDFYHNIVASTPQFRQQFGAGEKFLDGINTACAARNMTAQLCAGNPPSFLEALTMPSITNARASIDYDWDGDPAKNSGPRSSNGAHNWAAPDNAWVFRASRIAPSKDNFWSSWRDLKVDGGNQDSGRNGKDSEMHAAIALLLTGPVGLGDTCVRDECMVNATLVRTDLWRSLPRVTPTALLSLTSSAASTGSAAGARRRHPAAARSAAHAGGRDVGRPSRARRRRPSDAPAAESDARAVHGGAGEAGAQRFVRRAAVADARHGLRRGRRQGAGAGHHADAAAGVARWCRRHGAGDGDQGAGRRRCEFLK